MYTNLLVATDGSRLSEKAVIHGIGLAKRLGVRITAFHVVPELPEPIYAEGMVADVMSRKTYMTETSAFAESVLGRIAKKAAAAGVPCTTHHALSRSPSEAILAAAKKYKCDTIVMGSHGRGGLASLLLGSVTQKVLAHTKLPVIVVR